MPLVVILRSRLFAALTVILLLVLSIWPALYNGFPIFHVGDSIGLVDRVARGTDPRVGFQTFLYDYFLSFFGGAHSVWSMILLQAGLTIYVVLRSSILLIPPALLLYRFVPLALIASVTTLPFFVSGLKQDAFTPLIPLSFFLVIMEKKIIAKILALSIVCMSVLMHTSHIPLFFLLCIAISIFACVYRSRFSKSQLFSLFSASFLVVLLVMSICIFDSAYLFPRRNVLNIAGKLTERNLLYLAVSDLCLTQDAPICAFSESINSVPRYTLMWSKSHVEFNNLLLENPELGRKLYLATLYNRPLDYLLAAGNTILGLFSNRFQANLYFSQGKFRTQIFDFYRDAGIVPDRVISFSFPDSFAKSFRLLISLHTALLFIALFFLIISRRSWGSDPKLLLFFVLIFVSFFCNLIFSALTAAPQSRLILRLEWLFPFLAFIVSTRFFIATNVSAFNKFTVR